MGKNTCIVDQCAKRPHGNGRCISHFFITPEAPAFTLGSDECIPWTGRRSRFQEAAQRSMALDGKPVPHWGWVQVNCASEACLNTDHLTANAPVRLMYPRDVCIYCGRPGYTKDHILPRHWSGDAARTFVATVPACGLCNSILNDTLTWSINERRAVCHRRLERKFSRLLAMPEWTHYQLQGIEGDLRAYILDEVSKRTEVRRMLKWPDDPHYDARALEKSGIENPYETGLIAAVDETFIAFVDAVA